MEFEVSRTNSEQPTENRLVLRRPRPAHISVLLRSNSGGVPIADCAYRILVGDRFLEGTTDGDGLVQHENVPPGDYPMEVEGFQGRVTVSTLPCHIVRSPIRGTGLMLFEDELEQSPPSGSPEQTAAAGSD